MKLDEKTIGSVLEQDTTVAVALLLAEGISVGGQVYVIADPSISAFDGQRGTVRKINGLSGTCDVEFANGTTCALQSNLLVPIK
jgi:hypothetical protein